MEETRKVYNKDYKAGQIIFCEFEPGTAFYMIRKGKVRISKISENQEKILDVLEEGSIFGEMAILEQAPRSATAIAETDVILTEFTKDNFKELLGQYPDLLVSLIRILSKRIFEAKRRLSVMQLKDEESKIIDAILMLVENSFKKDPETINEKEITINVSIEELGNWCGIDEKKAKTILFDLQRAGKVDIKPGAIVVKDLQDFVRTLERKRKFSKLENE